MEHSFWLQKWEKNEIAFHEKEANPLLVKFFGELNLIAGSHVFVPLCGKTLDIAWLLGKGYHVVGAELSEAAIRQLFAELGVAPQILELGPLKRYRAENIDIFVGDIFELSAALLGPIDAIYDRAALVALPEAMRLRYAEHLRKITDTAPQLLVTYEYDQNLMAGPPFSVDNAEVQRHYATDYDLRLLQNITLPGGLKGHSAVKENVWLLGEKLRAPE
jgi:thiopurine S-methyltransferase